MSITEENYLKALLHLTLAGGERSAGTNDVAAYVHVKPATAVDMLKKLKTKKLIEYEKYGKSSLTKEGKKLAIEIVRKHRLWETFLFQKLEFSWDEVHEVAEQLEHIKSDKLISRLDKFLGFPTHDPHGDVIPDAKGVMKIPAKRALSEEIPGHACTLVAVKDNSSAFLKYADKIGLSINKKIKVISKENYDGLIEIEIDGKTFSVGPRFAENILVVCKKCAE